MRTRNQHTTRMIATGLFAVAGLGLAGCGPETEEPTSAGEEIGADVEDVTGEEEEGLAMDEDVTEEGDLGYEGVYDDTFLGEADSYIGEEITLSAGVDELISPDAFTIGEDVDSLLVIETQEIPEVDTESTVEVTGTLRDAFDIVTVEEELGTDLEDALYEDFVGGRYLMATSADVQAAE